MDAAWCLERVAGILTGCHEHPGTSYQNSLLIQSCTNRNQFSHVSVFVEVMINLKYILYLSKIKKNLAIIMKTNFCCTQRIL